MIRRLLSIFGLIWLLAACSVTKSIPEGDAFYKGSRIHIQKMDSQEEWEVEKATEKYGVVYYDLWDSPNGGLFGSPFISFFPARLYIYNWFSDTTTSGVPAWLRDNFGEAPNTIEHVNPEAKLKRGKEILANYGHFGAESSYVVNYNKKRNKGYVHYYFQVPKPYKYSQVNFHSNRDSETLNKIFADRAALTKLKPGSEFNLYEIRDEKKFLWNQLQNSGYYFIGKNDLLISADTTFGQKQVILDVDLTTDLPSSHYQRQTLGEFKIAIDSTFQKASTDKFYRWPTGRIRKRVVDSLLVIQPGDYFSKKNTESTIRNLNSLSIYSNPRIHYGVSSSDSTLLKPHFILDMLDATNISFNVRGNYKNTGYIGPAFGFTFRQLNVFHGAENLTISGDVYYDFPFGIFKERVSPSSGYSIRSSITAPFLAHPFNLFRNTYDVPREFFTLNFDYNHRTDYFDLIAINSSYGWTWKSSERWSHKLAIIDVTLSNVRNTTNRFDELTDENPALRESLIDQFILGSTYEINYNRPSTKRKRWDFFYQGIVDLAGNSLNGLNTIFTDDPRGEQTFLGNSFAQFFRIKSQIVAKWNLTNRSQLVFRNMTGIGVPYGNSSQMPYIKEFFIGGTNSLRPYTARTVGPGRFVQFDQAEVNQVGDFKLEFNLEYRFPLVWKINMAYFIDAGNIWLLEPDPNRPWGEVRWGKLAADSYYTTGLGLRFQSDYIVLRADVGLALYFPFAVDGQKWVWQSDVLQYAWAPVFAIGYPF